MRGKKIKRAIITLFVLFISISLLSTQSLVEVAKKEKERCAKLKNKSTKVITNADLRRKPRSGDFSVDTASPFSKRRTEQIPKSTTNPIKDKIVQRAEQKMDQEMTSLFMQGSQEQVRGIPPLL